MIPKMAAMFLVVAVAAHAGVLDTLSEAGVELHGFAECRYGVRTQSDPFERDTTLNEARLQLDALWYHDLVTAELKADLVHDHETHDRDDIDLETGTGFLDLRQANVLFSPLDWMDVKVGRQVLTWGTGDLVFINDLFPKDWQSFFLGRDVEYLKAPSDALFISCFPAFANVDIAYAPRFDADRHITGERISYWNGQMPAGRNAPLTVDRPDDWFSDDEIAARVYRNVGAYELAAYGYHGFWKSPGGLDPSSGNALFPALGAFGASARGALGSGIASVETGYYDSIDDRDGDDPFVNNSEARLLLGYEREMARNLTVGVQYYLERMLDHGAHLRALAAMQMDTATARDAARHTVTLRLTWLVLNQNLVLSCFTRYSPSDNDAYIKPTATYKLSDRWQAAAGADCFLGEERHTFLGQFKRNNNLHASVRCSF